MAILTGPAIRAVVGRTAALRANRAAGLDACRVLPEITITPFDPNLCGPNSYDVHLNSILKVYTKPVPELLHDTPPSKQFPLDFHADDPTYELVMPPEGFLLNPGTLYLASTVERTVCSGVVPWLDGRSSVGRKGVHIHATAGRGDDGFGEDMAHEGGCSWTLELSVVHPVIIYPGMRIGQLTFFTIQGDRQPYKGRYAKQGADPVSSKFHEPDPE